MSNYATWDGLCRILRSLEPHECEAQKHANRILGSSGYERFDQADSDSAKYLCEELSELIASWTIARGSLNAKQVFARDGGVCHLCGLIMSWEKRGTGSWDSPEVDHLTPSSLDGSDWCSNLAIACKRCNSTKGADPTWAPSDEYKAEILLLNHRNSPRKRCKVTA